MGARVRSMVKHTMIRPRIRQIPIIDEPPNDFSTLLFGPEPAWRDRRDHQALSNSKLQTSELQTSDFRLDQVNEQLKISFCSVPCMEFQTGIPDIGKSPFHINLRLVPSIQSYFSAQSPPIPAQHEITHHVLTPLVPQPGPPICQRHHYVTWI